MKTKTIVMQHVCVKHCSPYYPLYKRERLRSFVTITLGQNAWEYPLICITAISWTTDAQMCLSSLKPCCLTRHGIVWSLIKTKPKSINMHNQGSLIPVCKYSAYWWNVSESKIVLLFSSSRKSLSLLILIFYALLYKHCKTLSVYQR